MTGSEIVRELDKIRTPGQCFIKWWKENNFADYEMVQTFRENVAPDQEFAGFELLDLRQMWDALERMYPDSVSLETRPSGECIVWRHDSGAGEMVVEECPFTPESVMMIYDIETRGKVIH